MVEKITTREAYGRALAELGDKYDFYVVDADVSKATRTEIFAKKFPERFFNFGISEADMIATAAGIASCGKPVFASSFAMFAAGRAYDQVRNSVGYTNMNVKIAATHGGTLINDDGGSHQCVEDISLMRTIPGMTVIVPSDALMVRCAVEAALLYKGPVYLRFGGKYAPELIYDEKDFNFEIGKGFKIKEGTDATVIACGDMVRDAIVASEELTKEGISVRVIDMPTIKPIDKDMIVAAAKETGAVVTAEDHNIIGGLGSAVAEVLIENYPVPMKRVGVMDRFGLSGSREDVAEILGLNSRTIIENIKAVIREKR